MRVMKPVPGLARSCPICLACLVLAGGGTALAEEPVRDCTAAAQTYQEINLSSGVYTERAVAVVPLKIKVPAGVDTGLEDACLKVAGEDAGSRMTAEFERAEGCRQAARRVNITAAAGDSPAQIGGQFDTVAYEACLRGDVEVKVLDRQP